MNAAKQLKTQQFLTFSLDGETFGIDVLRAREVIDRTVITRVPQTPGYMLGVINLRGSVVPVIDMRLTFGLDSARKQDETCIIVMEIAIDGDTVVVGAVVDAVQEVLELDADLIEPPPRLGTRLKTDFIRGIGRQDEKFIILLDIDRIFSADELAMVQSVGQITELPAAAEA